MTDNEIDKLEQILKSIEEYSKSLDANESFDNMKYKYHGILSENKYFEDYINSITSKEKQIEIGEELLEIAKSSQREGSKLKRRINQRQHSHRAFVIKVSSAIAAAIAIVSFVLFNAGNLEITEKMDTIAKNNVTPTLIINNGGKVIHLERLQNADTIANNENTITKENASKLSYKNNNQKKDLSELNRLIVPKTYTYTVVLSDGTEVNLNANSELIYPVVFSNNVRLVKLKGEGYFKVTKSEVPFIIETTDINIKVYGTEFNINAHKGDCIETTLISGSIGVLIKDGTNKEIIIRPNEQLIHNIKTKQNSLIQVNTENFTAWLDGKFQSQKEPLENLIIAISNWYDIEFKYQSEFIKNIPINAIIYRDNSLTLEDVFKIIEATIEIKFINEGGGKYSIIAR